MEEFLVKKIIKKVTATTLSAAGILFAVPSAFCSGNEPGSLNLAAEGAGRPQGRNLRAFHMLTVGKYFESPSDFIKLAQVSKEYRGLPETYKYNPIEYDPNLFPNAQTLHIKRNEGKFETTFPNKKIKRLVYFPGSFSSYQFWQILRENGLIKSMRGDKVEYNWKRTLTLLEKNSPIHGCKVTFTSNDGKEIVFEFVPMAFESKVGTVRSYNDFLKCCDIRKNMEPNPIIKKSDYYEAKSIAPYGNLRVVGANAFSKFKSLKNVILPSSVKSIRHGAFSNCVALEDITLPKNLESIDEGAFNNCLSLEKINIPSSVTEIEDEAFRDCRALKSINIPGSIKEINKGTFQKCYSLESVALPNSVERIWKHAFTSCRSLKSIEIPNSVTNIEERAFSNCPQLTSVTLPNSIEKYIQELFIIANY